MFELIRKKNKFIVIEDDIKIIELKDKHGQVTLGIEVLDEVEIWREKIARNVQTENRNNLICIKITNYWGRKNCLTESQDCSYLLIKPSGH